VSHPYLSAADAALELLGRDEVAERWSEPSALPKMSVGAVAAHLASEVLMVYEALTDPAVRAPEEPVPLLDHYTRSAWVEAGLDDDVNVGIRNGAQQTAADGPDAVLETARRAAAEVAALLPAADLSAAVRMPWWGWALTMDDFLTTRMMEIVVHADDLAVSADTTTPEFDADVLGPVLALLTGVAVRRHGQASVVRALSRAERAPDSIAAF
jgi:hypothetical protein